MSENCCGKCVSFEGDYRTCSHKEQKRNVYFSHPICWCFISKGENIEQSDWAKKANQQMQGWSDKRLSEKWEV